MLKLPSEVELVRTSFPTTFTWRYGSEDASLRRLYDNAKRDQWDGATALDWGCPVEPEAENLPDSQIPIYDSPFWHRMTAAERARMRHESMAWILSQFLHGEQGALLATAQIVAAVPSADAKLYAATQVMDEARHVEAYDRYLREKIECTFPISPHLESLLDTILRDSRWDMKYLGMQIMVEGLALAAFGFIHQLSSEPLIRDITHRIMQDEARHVAFGVLSLKDAYKEMPEKELRDREEFIIESSWLLRDRFLGQEVWQRLGLPQKECEEAAEKSEMMRLFRTLLFSKIVPNVKRLGLLTPHVRKGFEELGVIQFESLAD